MLDPAGPVSRDSRALRFAEQAAQFRLFELKSGRTDGYAADHDIDAIYARPERARAQVIDVLAIVDPEA